ncbi:MAG: hypothetical protein KDC41_20060 [Saprospiraceae bacterium]|nr:hypothetical protein [Saprospiraceae bacterium]
MKNHVQFFREGLRNLKTVGTLTRSSRFLCRKMVGQLDFSVVDTIVELGAGDGVITHYILEQMRPNARLFAFEVLPTMYEKLQQIDDPRLIVVTDSAENIGHYLNEHGVAEIDCVISAIPFVALPNELGYRIIEACKQYLKKGGLFVQVHYSLLAKKLYEDIFGNVLIKFVPLNVPPAFVLVSEKQ